ncbi:MAG: hypothetical protein AB1763_08735 [Campylobacterota bacterium]
MSDLSNALLRCRKKSEKIQLTFRCPIDLKNDFSSVAKENNVSFASLLVALMSVAIEDHKKLKA